VQLSATKKLAFSVTTLALALLVVEVASQMIYRWRSPDDLWIFQAAKRQHRLFQEHPFLSVAPIANVRSQHGDTVITHNRDGLRGYELSDDGNRARITALGGSSTYGVYVRDEHVWPHQPTATTHDEVENIPERNDPQTTPTSSTSLSAQPFADDGPT